MSDETESLFNQIVQAIEVALSPASTPDARLKANTLIEEIKSGLSSNFERSFAVAFKLLNYSAENASDSNHATFYTKLSNINNFGLQIIELMVKFNWSRLTDAGKLELKQMMENIVCKKDLPMGTLVRIYENRLLKDQFSRLLVEILMREWPQHWCGFLSMALGQPKNELVLYTLWRLSEDIGIFFLPNNPQRRREMNNELNQNLEFILNYIADCLALDNIDLTILALKTLCSFFEWNTLRPDALSFLCKVLTVEMSDTDSLFKLFNSVADCFFTCLNRKSFKPDEKKVLLVFFEEQNLTLLITFLEKLLQFVQLKIEGKVIDERTFDLVKRVCDVFQLMGQTCISICAANSSPLPATWPAYLLVMLQLLEYDNQIYNYYSLQFWKDLFKNQHLKENGISEELVLKILKILPHKMVKRKEMNNIFLVYEFDGSADYDVFFTRFRSEFGDFLRSLTKHSEKLCFELAISLTKQALESQCQNKNEWTTISVIMDSVCNYMPNPGQFVDEALPVLKFMIAAQNLDDPELMSIMLSTLSALSVFVQFSKEDLLRDFLTKLFSLMNYEYSKEPTFAARDWHIRELRRHICSLFIRISMRCSKSLLPLFNDIRNFVYALEARPEIGLTQNEKCSLFDGLILLSNHFADYYQQTEFIVQILKPVNWLLDYNMSTLEFVRHIGLTSPQAAWNLEGHAKNRMGLVYAVSIINVIIKRVTRKVSLLPDFLPYIASLTKLIRNLNEMWMPEVRQACYPDYREIIYAPILEKDRVVLLESFVPGVKQQSRKEEEDENFYNTNRMQTFLWLLHENCYAAIGHAAGLMNLELYNSVETVDLIHSIGNLPDYKFRAIFKVCLKPLISNCPRSEATYEKKIFPLLNRFLPAFFEKLNQKWDVIKQLRNGDPEATTGAPDNERLEAEVLEEATCQCLSKEFIDFLCLLLVDKLATSEEEKLSTLGIYILKQFPDLIYMTATLMTWLDSVISMRATMLTTKIMDKLAEDEIIKTSNATSFIIKQVLIALGYFGEHDQNQALLLGLFIKMYENYVLRYDFRDIKTQLAEYSGKNTRLWANYDERRDSLVAKKKKEAIKNLLSNVIGKNLSQLFKQQGKEEIRNLEPLLSRAERTRRDQKLENTFDEENLDDTFFKFF